MPHVSQQQRVREGAREPRRPAQVERALLRTCARVKMKNFWRNPGEATDYMVHPPTRPQPGL